MKTFLFSLRVRLQQFMAGRYGYDELSRILSISALVLLLLGYVPGLSLLSTLAMALWIWLIFRALSRNIEKRQAERNAYLKLQKRRKDWFYIKRQAWLLRDTYRFYRCKECKTYVRVPKGKGKIQITCPKCGNRFIKKT